MRLLLDGTPPSFNALGTRSNHFKLFRDKQLYELTLIAVLSEPPGTVARRLKPGTKGTYLEIPVNRWGDLPERCNRITVEGRMTFPTRFRRDQGNYRPIIEKALGDALVKGGWLEDDCWDRYEFGGLAAQYVKGVRQTELLLFPG